MMVGKKTFGLVKSNSMSLIMCQVALGPNRLELAMRHSRSITLSITDIYKIIYFFSGSG